MRNIRERQLDLLGVFDYVEPRREVDNHNSTGESEEDVRQTQSSSTPTLLRSDRGVSEAEGESGETRVIGLDWAIDKSLVIFDGKEVHYYNSVQELLQNLNGETILCEDTIPRKLLDLSKFRVLVVDPKLVRQKRQELDFPKSDENDARVIWVLYQEQPQLFRELTERDWRIEVLRRKLKVVEKIQKFRKIIQHSVKSLQREYGLTDNELMILRALERRFIDLEEAEFGDLVNLAKRYFPSEIQQLIQIPGIGERVAIELLCILWGKEFPSFAHLKSYAGVAPNKGKFRNRDNRYSRTLRSCLEKIVLVCLTKKLQPYYTHYLRYKERKSAFVINRAHLDAMARRYLAVKILKRIWRVVRGWGR